MNCLFIRPLRHLKSFSTVNFTSFTKSIAPVKIIKTLVSVPSSRYFASRVLDVNTNVVKDVILYKHHNPRFMKLLMWFGVVQYTFWAYMTYMTHTSLKNIPIDPSKIKADTPWYMKINLGDPKYKTGLTITCGAIAMSTLFSVWGFTVRVVKYVVLHKGGGYVSFVTYSPVGPNRIHKVPVHVISCQQARNLATGFVPIKVKGIRMNFLVDTKGDFRNTLLFDNTVGLNRNLG